MPRRRIIDPQFWNDALIGRLPFEVRLLYIGIWNFTDDAGILPVDPAWLRASIFPHDEAITVARLRAMLRVLEDKKRLLRYGVDGKDYYLVARFHDHQTIEKPTPSRLPRPPKLLLHPCSDRTRRNVIARTGEPSADRREGLAASGRKTGKSKSGTPRVVGEQSPTPPRPLPEDYDRSEVKRSEVNENARAREGGKDDQDADRSRDRREGLDHAGGAAVRLAAQLAAGSR